MPYLADPNRTVNGDLPPALLLEKDIEITRDGLEAILQAEGVGGVRVHVERDKNLKMRRRMLVSCCERHTTPSRVRPLLIVMASYPFAATPGTYIVLITAGEQMGYVGLKAYVLPLQMGAK